MDRVLYLFPELNNFDVDTGERALFKECWEALQRQLPKKLRKEPILLGSLLTKMMHSPEYCGMILLDVVDPRFPNNG